MSVYKLGIIFFSSFLIFATAPLASAQSAHDQTQDQAKKQTKTKKSKKETGTTTQQKAPAAQNKAGTTEKTETRKAKKTKKTSSLSNENVREVQTALKNEGFDPGPIDGIMGPMTMTALRNYQSHNHLEVTGTLTAETQNALLQGATAGTSRTQQPTDQTQQSTSESLGLGSQSTASSVEDIKQVQQALADLQYNPGDINGIMTADTQQAIREFQYLNNLPVTGIVDEPTKLALDTQWRGGVENAQLGQTPLAAEREKPSSELQQNRTDTYNQNRTDNQNRADETRSQTYKDETKSQTYKQDQTDHSKTHPHAAGKVEKDAADRVTKAAAVLQDLTASADKRIPNGLLERAEAVAVIPHMIKGAFGIGGRYGKGVVAQRMDGGRWSAPAFIDIGGGSFGAQIGATATDLVLVFTDRKALDTLEGGKDLKLGVDAGVVAGPIGREAEAGTNAKLESAIYAYSRSKGLFAGIALDGAVLSMDKDTNRKVYGASVDAKQILNGNVAMNATVRPFVDELDRLPKKRVTENYQSPTESLGR